MNPFSIAIVFPGVLQIFFDFFRFPCGAVPAIFHAFRPTFMYTLSGVSSFGRKPAVSPDRTRDFPFFSVTPLDFPCFSALHYLHAFVCVLFGVRKMCPFREAAQYASY